MGQLFQLGSRKSNIIRHPQAAAVVRAFPSAEGWGADATGGRGGTLYKVTNLNDSGAGSLRAALTATGPRIILPQVSGTIELTTAIELGSTQGNFTYVGQASPGGLQIKNYGLMLGEGCSNVIIRHLRSRPGDQIGSAAEPDGVEIFSTLSGSITQNIILDHCSLQWAVDENLGVGGNVKLITVQWSIMAEGTNTGHSTGPHSAGALAASGETFGANITISFHHNVIAHNGIRNPDVIRCSTLGADIRNNVIYNWGSGGAPLFEGNNCFQMGVGPLYALDQSAFVNLVGNHFIKGNNGNTWAADGSGWHLFLNNGGAARERGGSKIYVQDNWGPGCPSGCASGNDFDLGFIDLDTGTYGGPEVESKYRVSVPFATPAVTTTATSALKALLTGALGAGARIPSRDAADQKIMDDINNLTGNISNNGGGGPWPTLTGGAAPTDTDGDGIPDAWESSHGLDPNNAADANQTAANGYTHIENWFNELAGDTISGY